MQLKVIQLVLVPLRVTLVEDNNLYLDSKKWYILDKEVHILTSRTQVLGQNI